jgi:hypothetical protein
MRAFTESERTLMVTCLRLAAEQFDRDASKAIQALTSADNPESGQERTVRDIIREFDEHRNEARRLAVEIEQAKAVEIR